MKLIISSFLFCARDFFSWQEKASFLQSATSQLSGLALCWHLTSSETPLTAFDLWNWQIEPIRSSPLQRVWMATPMHKATKWKKNTFRSIYLAAKRGLPCMGCQPLASWESCHSQLNEWAIIDIELQILSNFRSIKNLNHMINDVRDNSKSSIRSPSWRHLKNSYAQWSCTDAHSTWFNSSCRSYEY